MITYIIPLLIAAMGFSLVWLMAESIGLRITWRHLLGSVAAGGLLAACGFALFSL
jgi:hypothetical protein